MPFAQSLDQIIVGRNRFLRAFRLAETNNVLHDGARYVNLLAWKSTSFHFSANSSLLRRPVVTANNTNVRSLPRRLASKLWTSLLVKMSGAVRRLALCRTH